MSWGDNTEHTPATTKQGRENAGKIDWSNRPGKVKSFSICDIGKDDTPEDQKNISMEYSERVVVDEPPNELNKG